MKTIKEGCAMSTREIALNIFNTLSEEQLIEFIKSYSDGENEKNAEQEKAELEERRRAFEELSQMIEENARLYPARGDNYKEIIADCIAEKYYNIGRERAETNRTKREAYEHLKQLVGESAHLFAGIGDNDKEVLEKYRKEKYGL